MRVGKPRHPSVLEDKRGAVADKGQGHSDLTSIPFFMNVILVSLVLDQASTWIRG